MVATHPGLFTSPTDNNPVESPEFYALAHDAAQTIFHEHQLPGQDIPFTEILDAAIDLYYSAQFPQSNGRLIDQRALPLWLLAVGIEVGENRAHGGGDWNAPE